MSNNTMPIHKAAWIEELAIKIFNEIENLGWKNGFYRKDIGFRIIDK